MGVARFAAAKAAREAHTVPNLIEALSTARNNYLKEVRELRAFCFAVTRVIGNQ
jgi:hypothetical protein